LEAVAKKNLREAAQVDGGETHQESSPGIMDRVMTLVLWVLGLMLSPQVLSLSKLGDAMAEMVSP